MIEAIRIQIYNELNRRIVNQGVDELARDFLTKTSSELMHMDL